MAEQDIEVLVVDDHPVMGDGLVIVLGYEGITSCALVPASPEHALDVVRSCHPQLVLLDIDLGWPEQTGLDLIAPLQAERVGVIVYSATRDRRLLALALEAGAHGAVTKGQGVDDLVDALVRAREGEAVNSQRERAELCDELQHYRARHEERMAPFRSLTAREAAVLQELVEGYSAEAIAERSFVALSTVRSQIRSVLAKLDVTSQLAAVAIARRARWSADGHPDEEPATRRTG